MYNKLDYDALKEGWDNEDENMKKQKGRMVVLYICASAIIWISVAIYLGSKKW